VEVVNCGVGFCGEAFPVPTASANESALLRLSFTTWRDRETAEHFKNSTIKYIKRSFCIYYYLLQTDLCSELYYSLGYDVTCGKKKEE
jgi:hypothetical protein